MDAMDFAAMYDWSHGRAKTRMRRILFHVFVDEPAHLGELIALMWQLHAEPPWAGRLEPHIVPVADGDSSDRP